MSERICVIPRDEQVAEELVGIGGDSIARRIDIAARLAVYRAEIIAGLAFQPGSILEQMRDAAEQVHKATGCQMSAGMQAEVTYLAGGLVRLEFCARTGEVLGKGPTQSRYGRGTSPTTAAAELIEELTLARVSDAIRIQFLRQRAEELGFDIVPAKKNRRGEE